MGVIKPTAEQPLAVSTQNLMDSIQRNNQRARVWGSAFFVLLIITVIVGVIGIYQQNHIATKNQAHIDCIVKLLATPLPSDEAHKVITDPNETCGIVFSN